ncbi:MULTISPECIES: arylamine N-acetyltransferase family protein [Ensifer]|uniref:arylamine N-acetyltransferase family protein n=1 Tax=Ensifer TaxID=106591 RepID=UPI000DC27882|nr:arylamine N-acetyltransferase [Ensifer adhaerens]RAS13917.1 N-hydroxyarylamine O-acetyltransferase [Ensifer adhaerens]
MRNAPFPVDLGRYFARIGHVGPLSPDLTTLGRIVARHAASIPFEAIDVLLGRRIDLSPAAVDAKLIDRRRGGYCFEQNGLLQRVLTSLGYRVDPLIARVLWMRSPGAPPPAWSHMALRVFVNDVGYLVDVGFGSCVPTAPLRFDRTTPQPTQHEPFRLSRTLDGYVLEALLGRDWVPVYEVSPSICGEDAYRIANIATYTDPHSLFRQTLLVTLTTEETRNILLGNRLTIRDRNGTVTRQEFDAPAIESALMNVFGLPLDGDWRRIAARAGGAFEASIPTA